MVRRESSTRSSCPSRGPSLGSSPSLSSETGSGGSGSTGCGGGGDLIRRPPRVPASSAVVTARAGASKRQPGAFAAASDRAPAPRTPHLAEPARRARRTLDGGPLSLQCLTTPSLADAAIPFYVLAQIFSTRTDSAVTGAFVVDATAVSWCCVRRSVYGWPVCFAVPMCTWLVICMTA